jgi:anti-sigma factor RsiW
MAPEISETEVEAYIDGELDLERRLAVESWLVEHPESAVRVIADFRSRTALALLQLEVTGSARLMANAARLSRRLPSVPTAPRRLMSIAAGVVLAILIGVGLIFPGSQAVAEPPRYVADAFMAYRTAVLRANMASQPESPVLDKGEILRATRIKVPPLPAGWQLTDAQIFPSHDGPALQIMVRAADGKRLSIFAVRSPSAAPRLPVSVRRGDMSVAYWRNGDVAYAVTGSSEPEALGQTVEGFAAAID